MDKMTDQQKSAIQREMEQQKPGRDSMQALPPILPRTPTPPEPSAAPSQVTEGSETQNTGAGPSQQSSVSTTIYDGEDVVDYGSTDDDTPGPLGPSTKSEPTPTVPAKVMCRYSTQWLKIWRSYVASEHNSRRFADSNGFGPSGDKWAANDEVRNIAEAFFEVCLFQSGSFQSAIDNYDSFKTNDYHKSFLDAFQQYLKDHPADSY